MKREIAELNSIDPHHAAELLLLASWVVHGPFAEMERRIAFVKAEYLMDDKDTAMFLAAVWQLNAEATARRW